MSFQILKLDILMLLLGLVSLQLRKTIQCKDGFPFLKGCICEKNETQCDSCQQGYYESKFSIPSCTDFTTESTCNKEYNCKWLNTTSECKPDYAGSSFQHFKNPDPKFWNGFLFV